MNKNNIKNNMSKERGFLKMPQKSKNDTLAYVFSMEQKELFELNRKSASDVVHFQVL